MIYELYIIDLGFDNNAMRRRVVPRRRATQPRHAVPLRSTELVVGGERQDHAGQADRALEHHVVP